MKKLLLSIALIAGLLFGGAAHAVEYIVTYPDKSQLFKCEMHGSVFKVKVKYRGNGVYTVIVVKRSTTGFSGNVSAGSHNEAARVGCGGE